MEIRKTMRFCDNCGSFLRETKEGLLCPKCRRAITVKPRLERKTLEKRDSAAIFVADKSEGSHAEVYRACPNCGNTKAFHWFSTISGEHAGVRRERTVKHFKCVKCSHSWTESS